MAKKEEWVEFYIHGVETGYAYTVRGTFPGEEQATKTLIAAEYGVKPEDVTSKRVIK